VAGGGVPPRRDGLAARSGAAGDLKGVATMKRTASSRRLPEVHITLGRAARLHRLVTTLAAEPRPREELLKELAIGLRTFYRELELLKRCKVRVRLVKRAYTLQSTAEEAEGRLPFPDPQLSFAELRELAAGPGQAARRLAELLAKVVATPAAEAKPKGGRRSKSAKA
jgi:hypothetical protein